MCHRTSVNGEEIILSNYDHVLNINIVIICRIICHYLAVAKVDSENHEKSVVKDLT